MSQPVLHEPSMLLISDLAGCGKVALSVMIPVLSHFELNVSSLPTALVSNTLTTVETTLTSEEERACQELCYDLGVNYRIRPWQN